MLDHVIMFKAAALTPEGEAELFAELARLKEVPGVVDFALGKNFGDRSRGFDFCMRVTFKSREDLAAYDAHPVHKSVVTYNRAVTDEHICVDFEWDG
jgi:hypothetical protein